MKKNINFTEKQMDMVDMIKKEIGVATFSAVISYAITTSYRSLFPSYRTSSPVGNSFDPEYIERKAKIKVELEDAKKKIVENKKYAPKIKICENILKGRIEQGVNGKVCIFKTFYDDPKEDFEQKVPLVMCNEDLESSLFFPDRETVLKARKELKKIFE